MTRPADHFPRSTARPATRAGGRTSRPGWFVVLLGVALVAALAFLVLPVVAIFAKVSPARLISSLSDPQATDALILSLQTTSIALAIIIVVGTPAAYLLARRSFPVPVAEVQRAAGSLPNGYEAGGARAGRSRVKLAIRPVAMEDPLDAHVRAPFLA
ncbi:MAG: hypothetical protein M3Y09_19955 [Actinomycetota bacterium]|nr:hypothetical protein [Actinomycetota bacterium]